MLLYLREEELVFAKKNPPSGPNIFPDYISSRWKIFFSLLCILTGVLIFLGGEKKIIGYVGSEKEWTYKLCRQKILFHVTIFMVVGGKLRSNKKKRLERLYSRFHWCGNICYHSIQLFELNIDRNKWTKDWVNWNVCLAFVKCFFFSIWSTRISTLLYN